MAHSTKLKLIVIVLSLSWIAAQEYIENLHDSKIGTHFKEIPRSFELQGYDANTQFQKYFDRIQGVAMQENLNIVYKIKVDIIKPNAIHHSKRNMHIERKGKSKKYNIPLKKASMKLSNFEIWLRKMAEQSGLNKNNHAQIYVNNISATTEGEKIFSTAKQIQFKYKPIISRTKTNYTKFVKPVRSRIITLG